MEISYTFDQALSFAEKFLCYNGDVPANWSNTADPSLINKLVVMEYIKVGNILPFAFKGLNLSIEYIEADSILDNAFENCTGYITKLKVRTMHQNAIYKSDIYINDAYISENLCDGSQLKAKIISIPDSVMNTGIYDVKTLIIRNSFKDCIHTNATKVDFRTVEMEDMYRLIIRDKEFQSTKPGIVYASTDGESSSLSEALFELSLIYEDIQWPYSDVKTEWNNGRYFIYHKDHLIGLWRIKHYYYECLNVFIMILLYFYFFI
jgi:hypothetical protein